MASDNSNVGIKALADLLEIVDLDEDLAEVKNYLETLQSYLDQEKVKYIGRVFQKRNLR